MLERIEQIQGIGLFHDAVGGKRLKFDKATLLYADNGRGKSTFANILQSVATGDADTILRRETVDGKHKPNIVFHFENGHKVKFNDGAWSENRSEVIVFDANFIEKNVHSGNSISTNHRKELLEFALGEEAVLAKAEVEKAVLAEKQMSEKLKQISRQLMGYHSGVSLSEFSKINEVEDVDVKIEELRKRLVEARSASIILGKPLPNLVVEPKFDIDALFHLLQKTLDNIHKDAESTVRQHLDLLQHFDAENWLSRGISFIDGDDCPYCGQSLTGIDLVRAYQTYFNKAYHSLKNKVSVLKKEIGSQIDSSILDRINKEVDHNNSMLIAWQEYIPLNQVSFKKEELDILFHELRTLAFQLVSKKEADPIEMIGSERDKDVAHQLWNQILIKIKALNKSIASEIISIESYKENLQSENTQKIESEISKLQLTKVRYGSEVVKLLENMALANDSVKLAAQNKKDKRDNLHKLMQETLKKYEGLINSLLIKLGASFSISNMGANFRGNAPRSEYGLLLRGKSIPIEGNGISFSNALSEGDRRTLAFAFFVARILDSKNIGNSVVVIDDPMCSLDFNRRQYTRTILKKVYLKAGQLIVLAHDPYFLKDLKNGLVNKDKLNDENSSSQIKMLKIHHTNGSYSDFCSFDVDAECESPYFRHHRQLLEFTSKGIGDTRSVAKAIRPLLEGYLHRRFPGLVPKNLLFGAVVALIRDSTSSSPLNFAKNLVDELNEVNDYAGQFHHDTNPGNADTVIVNSSELIAYAKRALGIVHAG